ncbi:hypothetical protein HPB47_003185, partial [Ixodes persulcatus]
DQDEALLPGLPPHQSASQLGQGRACPPFRAQLLCDHRRQLTKHAGDPRGVCAHGAVGPALAASGSRLAAWTSRCRCSER